MEHQNQRLQIILVDQKFGKTPQTHPVEAKEIGQSVHPCNQFLNMFLLPYIYCFTAALPNPLPFRVVLLLQIYFYDSYMTRDLNKTLITGCALGTSDFDAQMSGIKIQKGNEILRPVYKKTIFRNIEWLLLFWAFQFIKSTH